MHQNVTRFIIGRIFITLLVILGIFIYFQYRFLHISLPSDFINSPVSIASQNLQHMLFPDKEYSWKECENTGISLLKKSTWYLFSEHVGSTKICYLTVEPYEKEGSFKTGVTVEIIDDYKNKTQIPVNEYAKNYIHEVAGLQLNAQSTEYYKDEFEIYSTSIEAFDDNRQFSVKRFVSAIANTRTQTLYIVSYETPVGEENTHREELTTTISAITLDRLH